MHRWTFQRAASILNLGLLMIYVTILFQLRAPLMEGYSDFVSFYTAGKILQRGTPWQLYDIGLQYEIQRETAPNVRIRQGALPFVRPPFEAWIFRPLAHLTYGAAFVIWNLFSCACLILTLLILCQEIPELHRISLSLMIASGVCYFPVFFTIVQGQDSLILLLIYVLAFKALRRDREFLCGLTLGLGVFKFPLVVPFLVPLAVKRRLRVILGFALTSSVLAVVSIATVGLPTAAYYPKYLLSIDTLAKGVNRPQDMPNIRGLLGLLPQTTWSPGPRMLLLLLFSILLLSFVVRKGSFNYSDRGPAFTLGLALNVVGTVLVSYHCHVFDLCVLLLPMGLATGFVLSNDPINANLRKRLIWALSLLMFSPLYLLATYTLKAPNLLAILLLGFGSAIGTTISELQNGRSMQMTAISTSPTYSGKSTPG